MRNGQSSTECSAFFAILSALGVVETGDLAILIVSVSVETGDLATLGALVSVEIWPF